MIKFLTYWYKLYNDGTLTQLSRLRGIATPTKYNVIFGDILGMKDAKSGAYEFFNKNNRLIGELSNYKIWLFYSPVVIINNVHDMSYILNKGGAQFTKSYTYEKFYGWWLGNSILLAEGTQHSQQRKLFNSAFHYDAIKSMTGE